MKIRAARPGDEQQLIDLFARLDRQTSFMLFEPDERSTTIDEQAAIIERATNSDRTLLLVAEHNDAIVGFLGASGNQFLRNRHVVAFAMGVDADNQGRGIGKALIDALETWAEQNDYYRIEMTVQKENNRARRLYESCGFKTEGVKSAALRIGGRYVDELYMAKLLPNDKLD